MRIKFPIFESRILLNKNTCIQGGANQAHAMGLFETQLDAIMFAKPLKPCASMWHISIFEIIDSRGCLKVLEGFEQPSVVLHFSSAGLEYAQFWGMLEGGASRRLGGVLRESCESLGPSLGESFRSLSWMVLGVSWGVLGKVSGRTWRPLGKRWRGFGRSRGC